MLKWFHSDLILQNIEEMRGLLRPLLRADVVERVQQYLREIQREEGRETTFVRWEEGILNNAVEPGVTSHLTTRYCKELKYVFAFIHCSINNEMSRTALGNET